MTGNPLLDGTSTGPAPTCATGWHEMRLPRDGYKGHSTLTLTAADICRVHAPDLNTDPRVCSRLYHPGGDVCGLFTDRSEFMMLEKRGKRGKLMADAAGVWLLKGKLPWGKVPIPLDPSSLLAAMGVKNYPFSVLSHVVVTGPMPSDMLDAMVRAYRLDAMMAYGGLPVLGLPDNDPSGLEQVKWPKVKILAYSKSGSSEKLADLISDVLFEVEVEVLDG